MRTPKTTSPTGNGARGGACVRGPQPGGRRACRPVPGWVVQAQPPCPALWSVAQTQGPSLLLGLRVSLAEDVGASGAASFFDDGSLADLGQSRLHPGVASQAGCLLHVVTLTCRPHGAVVAPLRAGRREGPGGRGAACAGGAAHHPDVGLGSGPSWGGSAPTPGMAAGRMCSPTRLWGPGPPPVPWVAWRGPPPRRGGGTGCGVLPTQPRSCTPPSPAVVLAPLGGLPGVPGTKFHDLGSFKPQASQAGGGEPGGGRRGVLSCPGPRQRQSCHLCLQPLGGFSDSASLPMRTLGSSDQGLVRPDGPQLHLLQLCFEIRQFGRGRPQRVRR